MRIAYVCADSGVPVFGRKGCSIHVQEIIRALQRRGAQITLFARRLEGEAVRGLEAVRLHQLSALHQVKGALREQMALAANHELRRALEREGPFDLVYERYSLWSFAAMEYARKLSLPGLLEVNAPLLEEQAQHRTLTDVASATAATETVFKAASSLIAVSEEVAAYLHRFRATQGRVHIIPNGVDPERFSPQVKPACPAPGAFTVGFVGSLKPWHGLSVLVAAFALLLERAPKARLLIVGDGPERAKLEADLTRRGLLSSACLTGSVDPDAVPGLLTSMDVAVAPYPEQVRFYFSPLKVFEYLAAGLPVVASRSGQLAKLITAGVNGLLCPPGDARALADRLYQLHQNPLLRARLGTAARATVTEQYTWDAIARRILNLARLKSVKWVEVSN